jgi:hypothetical protein
MAIRSSIFVQPYTCGLYERSKRHLRGSVVLCTGLILGGLSAVILTSTQGRQFDGMRDAVKPQSLPCFYNSLTLLLCLDIKRRELQTLIMHLFIYSWRR